MAKHIAIAGSLATDDLVTLKRGATTKQLQVLGCGGIWYDIAGLTFTFDQSDLSLSITGRDDVGHTALLSNDALILLDYT